MKPVILFIHPGILAPIQGGGPARTWALIDHFRLKGYEVALVTSSHGQYNNEIEQKVDYLYVPHKTAEKQSDGIARDAIVSRLKRHGEKMVMSVGGLLIRSAGHAGMHPLSCMQRNRHRRLETLAGKAACECRPVAAIATYAWLARALDHMPPGTLRILDTIDVQHKRAELARQSGGNLDHVRCTKEEEVRELKRADILLAIQEEEGRMLYDMCPDRQLICVRHAVEVPGLAPSSDTGASILYVGSNYDPNVKGLEAFLVTTWPHVLQACPHARLTVCGTICKRFKSPVTNVIFAGVVPELKPYYDAAHIVINPVSYGTGIKIKSVEALAHGRCLVCTQQGTLGLGPPDSLPLVVAEPGKDMAQAIVALLEDPEKRHCLEKCAHAYALECLSAEAVYGDLTSCIEAYSQTENTHGLS